MFPPVAKPGLGLQQTHTESRPWSEPHSLLDPRVGTSTGGGGSQEATCPTVGHGAGGQACPSRPPASSEALLSGKCGEVPAPGASPRPPPFFPTLQTRGRQGHGGGAGASRPRGSPPPPGPEPQGGAGDGERLPPLRPRQAAGVKVRPRCTAGGGGAAIFGDIGAAGAPPPAAGKPGPGQRRPRPPPGLSHGGRGAEVTDGGRPPGAPGLI